MAPGGIGHPYARRVAPVVWRVTGHRGPVLRVLASVAHAICPFGVRNVRRIAPAISARELTVRTRRIIPALYAAN